MRHGRVLWVAAVLCLAMSLAGGAAAQSAGKEVTVKTPDNVSLAATYFSAGKPGPGVILLHMCNSNRRAWTNLAGLLAKRGVHVLTLDYRGFGESGGERLDDFQAQQRIVTEKWPGDVDAALNYLAAQAGVDRNRIGTGGGSCGVNQAIQLARRHPEVKTLALLAGGTNQDGRRFLQQASWMPLFATAALDDGDAVRGMRWLLGFSNHSGNKFVEYPRGGHGTELFAVYSDLEPAIADWFERHLIKSPVDPATTPAVVGAPLGPSAQFWETLTAPGGPARAMSLYRDAKKKDPAVMLFPEGEMNLLGYEYLGNGRVSDAIEVFKLNVEAYPQSANVYDSLSDAYIAAGQRELALQFVEKTLQALPGDTNAPEQFKQQLRDAAQTKLQQLRAAPAGTGNVPPNSGANQPANNGQPAAPAPAAAPRPAAAPAPPIEKVYAMPAVLTVPGMEAARVRNGVVYKTVDEAAGKRELKMDVYAPASAQAGDRFPAVILVSGGGVEAGEDRDWRGAGVYVSYGRMLAASGFVAIPFSKRYARGSVPAGESDLLDLIRHVRERAAEYYVDPGRLAVWGFSGGGWLVSVPLRDAMPYVRAVVCYYGVMDVTNPNIPADQREALARFSSVAAVRRNGARIPPVLVARAGLDNADLNAGIDAFVREALARNVEIEVLNHANGRHGFDILDDNERSREIIRATLAFLKQHLR